MEKTPLAPKTQTEEKESFGTKVERARNTKSTRIWVMIGLLAILFLLWWFGKIKTAFAVGLGIVLLAAIGVQTMDYDLDLGSLWAGKSIQESRVQQKDGVKLMGSCVAASAKNKADLDCSNFKTQSEAQAKYDQCADQIASNNKSLDKAKIMSLDIYGLDGNKNGIVCESLPRGLTPAQ
jgi:hypothetical protein